MDFSERNKLVSKGNREPVIQTMYHYCKITNKIKLAVCMQSSTAVQYVW